MRFREYFLEVTRNSGDWLKLHDLFIAIFSGRISPYQNLNAHHQLVDALHQVGLDRYAAELDALAPTDEERRISQRSTYGLGGTMGDVLKSKASRDDLKSVSKNIRTYMDRVDNIYSRIVKPDPHEPGVHRWPFTDLRI